VMLDGVKDTTGKLPPELVKATEGRMRRKLTQAGAGLAPEKESEAAAKAVLHKQKLQGYRLMAEIRPGASGGLKLAVNSAPLIADWAVLDATLTLGLPGHVTAATGIDAIVHAVEAYTSARLKNPLSDALAREALRLLNSNLLRVIEQPSDLEARSAMLLGAHLAGLAFSNAPVAGVHALAYPLGGLHHLPHGLTNALMLRHVLAHNLEAARDHYAELAEIIEPECAGEGSQARAALLIDRLDELAKSSGLALRLRDHGVAFEEAPTLAREAMKQTRLLVNNPCDISESDAQRLYEAAW